MNSNNNNNNNKRIQFGIPLEPEALWDKFLSTVETASAESWD